MTPPPKPDRRIPIRRLLPAAGCLLLLLAGCPDGGTRPRDDARSDGPKLAGVDLRLLVVDDPQLAAAVDALQGEWNAQTGSKFQVESITQQQFDDSDLADTNLADADAVVCPSCQLGPLAERGMLSEIQEELLCGDVADRADVFPLVRRSEAVWAGETMAVPFGSPTFVCYYRADLLRQMDREPPRTWPEYQELAELLAADAPHIDSPLSGTVEPLGPGWAGLVLLARAAPYAKHRDNYSTLLDIHTMEPLVAGPPFVRALEELVAAARSGPADVLELDPAATRAAFWQGQCGMALSWPTAAAGLSAEAVPGVEVGFAELPGSPEVFDVGKQSWASRAEDDEPHVPLVAMAGRIGVVARRSAHPAAAAELLAWLSGEQLSDRVSAATPATTLFRQSHRDAPQVWVEKPVSLSAATQYATVAEATFSRRQWVCALRIPGRAEYLAALDEAVRQAVRGERSPAKALEEAAATWQQITERLGPEQQRAAYLHSLGREP
jgi:multiple sugar transport system substrate-binding protein